MYQNAFTESSSVLFESYLTMNFHNDNTNCNIHGCTEIWKNLCAFQQQLA